MGVSDKFHYGWLNEAIAPVRQQVLDALPSNPQVLGIGEQQPNPFLTDLLMGRDFGYLACDLFPTNPNVIACDMNDLSPVFGKIQADAICLFRSSYFIKKKSNFFEQLNRVLKPGGFLFVDFLIGSSDLPVLDFRFGDTWAAFAYEPEHPALFQTSFYDDKLLIEFPEQVEAFCTHARSWPLSTKLKYAKQAPRFFLRDVADLHSLTPESLGHEMRSRFDEENLFSLQDFQANHFEVLAFSSRYFYPSVRKFNLYCFAAARLRGVM